MLDGGVVRVVHAGDVTAWRKFDALLKHIFSECSNDVASIRIDSHWHTTKFFPDILNEFDRKLAGVGILSSAAPTADTGSVQVLSGNEVRGNAEFRIAEMHLHGPSAAQQTARRDAAVADIAQRAGMMLERGGRLMVAIHHGAPRDQAPFWRDFWRRGLSNLPSRGMLLVHYVEEGTEPHADAPEPDVEIVLPRDLSDESREADAYDDLIDVLMTQGIGKEVASGMAYAHLNSHNRSMSEFYNSLSSLIMRINMGAVRS